VGEKIIPADLIGGHGLVSSAKEQAPHQALVPFDTVQKLGRQHPKSFCHAEALSAINLVCRHSAER